ncbi:MAG: hypothetical protein JST54_12495 [Deltaproteobacteria bacterium]|nr:hypothetical protein [Deltaproteobacteria bacterium]
MIHLALALALAAAPYSPNTLDGSPFETAPFISPAGLPAFLDTFAATGLTYTDANTVTNVTWNGTQLVDASGQPWSMVGTVTQLSGGTASPWFPNGFASNPMYGAEPSTVSNVYALSGSALNFAGDFSACVAFTVDDIAGAGGMFSAGSLGGASATGWAITVDNGGGNVAIQGWKSDGTFVLNSALGSVGAGVVGGAHLVCFGRTGTTWIGKLDLAGAVSVSLSTVGYGANTTAYIGRRGDPAGPGSDQGKRGIFWVWASTTTPSDALFTAIESRFFGHVANTGQTLSVSRASTATDVINGREWTFPTGVLRTDADGGYVEGASTNVVLQSQAFDNVAWQKNGHGVSAPTVTANAAVAPDGSTTADQIAFPAVSGAGNYSLVAQGFTASAAPWSEGVWLKASSGTPTLYLNTTPDGATYSQTTATLSTSWQHFCLSRTMTAATWYLQIGVDLRDASEAAQGAATIYAWQGQAENLAFCSADIATAGTSVTRSADAVTATKPSSITFKNGTWSLAAVAQLEGIGAPSWQAVLGSDVNYQPAIRLNPSAIAGSTNQNGDCLSDNAGTNNAMSPTLGDAQKLLPTRYAVSQDASTMSCSWSGQTHTISRLTQPGSEVSTLYLGGFNGSSNALYGHLSLVCADGPAQRCHP